MTTRISPHLPGAGPGAPSVRTHARPDRAYAVPVPRTPLLAQALPSVDWADAFAVDIRGGPQGRRPQDWADAIFRSPPVWVRILFGLRELLVRLVGIERGGRHVFDVISWRPGEVLLGTDQRHLAFRASVLVEADRVVLSTVVDVRSRRGLIYSALVRRIHPKVMRSLMARAARTMSGSSGGGASIRSGRSTRIAAVSPVATARRFPLLSLMVLACLFGWSFFVVEVFTGGSGAQNLPIGPFFAALIVTACQGRAERREWSRRIRNWRASARWYALDGRRLTLRARSSFAAPPRPTPVGFVRSGLSTGGPHVG